MSWIKEIYEVAQEAKLGETISNAFSALATKLGVGVEFVWGTLVKQAYVHGITNIILYLVGIAIALGFGRWASNIHKEDAGNDFIIIPFLIAMVVGVVTVIGFANTITETVTCLVNPNYWVFNELSTIIAKAKQTATAVTGK